MSVLIKKNDIPKGCEQCWFNGHTKCRIMPIGFDEYPLVGRRPDWCPLVEVKEPHWIPVTKDTPKEANTYMCTCSDAGRQIVTPVKWQPRTKTWNLTGARAYWKVIAWMQMPAPWKGE